MADLADRLKTLERLFSPDMVSLPRVQSPLDKGQHPPMNRGADKMHPQGMNYAEAYAKLLEGRQPNRFVELGVFTGVSLAMWCELFPEADVLGLDIDFNRVDMDLLIDRGAFQLNTPSMALFDAFDPQPVEYLENIDVFIDDGPHVTEAVIKVAEFMRDRMAPGSVYIVEDMANGAQILSDVFPNAKLHKFGMLNAVEL